MKSLVLKESSAIPILEVMEVSEPTLSSGEVLVQVAATGLCHHDISVMDGTIRRGTKRNVVLGHEISGTVIQINDDTKGIKVGAKVVTSLTNHCGECSYCEANREYMCQKSQGFGHGIDGGFSQRIALKVTNLIELDPSMDLLEACLMACPIGVALRALHDVARVKEGDDVVIFGIGGGLGIHLAQIAAAAGANVLGFTTHTKKLEKMASIGFEQVFLHQDGVDPSDLVMAFTEDKGADIVVNPVGSAVFTSGLRSLANNGCMVLLGEIKGESVAVNPAEIIFRDVSIVGCKGADMHHIETAIRMVSMGNIKPIIDSVFSFDEVLIAYDRVKSGLSLGRVVLVP